MKACAGLTCEDSDLSLLANASSVTVVKLYSWLPAQTECHAITEGQFGRITKGEKISNDVYAFTQRVRLIIGPRMYFPR